MTGERVAAQVERIRVGTAFDLVQVHVGEEYLFCTKNHPFLQDGGRWVGAEEIRECARLVSDSGQVLIASAQPFTLEAHPVLVYTIQVSGFQTYSVGRSRIIVHNKRIDW